VSMLPIDGINRETSISMILHSKDSGARYDCLPPGLCPRGLTLEQAAAFVGLSKSGYNKGRRRGDYPGPTLPGRRYDMCLLQAAMNRLSGIQENGGSTPLEQWRATRARSATGH
jgi:hypothetical protein